MMERERIRMGILLVLFGVLGGLVDGVRVQDVSAKMSLNNFFAPSEKIVNGNEVTSMADYPWLVSMGIRTVLGIAFTCTAAIVDETLVLSAAHCTHGVNRSDLYICFGLEFDSSTCRQIEDYVNHPDYVDSDLTLTFGFDLSLIKMPSSLLQDGRKVLMLSTLPVITWTSSASIGWGSTNDNSDPIVLRELDTILVTATGCDLLVGPSADARLVCADGDHDGTAGVTCSGDSGSPLLVLGDNLDDSYSVGVLSFVSVVQGTNECNSENESAYNSLSAASHIEFLEDAAASFGGSLTYAESDECDRDAFFACMEENDLSCALNDQGEDCCAGVETTLDCLAPIIDNCGNQQLINDFPSVSETLMEQCNPEEVACFPGNAVVTLEDGTTKPMDRLEAGDTVLGGDGEFSDVFGFSHRDSTEFGKFIRLEMSADFIELSPNHYLAVGDKLIAAKDVKVGDQISLANGDLTAVTAIHRVQLKGVYNPHTISGDIVVNGVLASTYTQTVNPLLAKLLLLFPKALYKLGLREPLGSLLYKTVPNAIVRWIPRGPSKWIA
uniref:Peptidase S1 domain-containing protein n=2 Tax=Rhodosorus marinus TaxID=101924 RepID=A0A7S3EN80_9RHOD|mmetsp:Transcript_7794/g.34718  ORF Transcript_7794/g.34718 Transcript_7794/m.34718 type:complete len:553 (+) Transcript_7794:97-1755(+)